MSYSIHEGIEDAIERGNRLKVVAQLYPKAFMSDLPNGDRVWCAEGLEKDADRISVVVDKKGNAWFCPYREVDGVRVFATWMRAEHAWSAIEKLQKASPDAYALLVWCSGGKPVPHLKGLSASERHGTGEP